MKEKCSCHVYIRRTEIDLLRNAGSEVQRVSVKRLSEVAMQMTIIEDFERNEVGVKYNDMNC